MDEKEKGFHSLFSRLCELAFTSEASKREDNYTRVFYTNSKRLALQTCLYDKLFSELQAPWVGGKKLESCVQVNKDDFDVYEKLAVRAFNLRVERRFDEADELEYYSAKWKSLRGKLKGCEDLHGTEGGITEPEAVLRFVIALEGTGPPQMSGVLGYQEKAWTRDIQQKDVKSNLPGGPLFNTDSHKLREQALLEPHYVHYSLALFERVPSLGLGTKEQPVGLQTFDQIARPTSGRMRFFDLQEDVEDVHDEKSRKSLFSALSHASSDDMQVRLNLPDLPTNPENKKYGLSTMPAVESPDDEGFHEVMDTSSELYSETASISMQDRMHREPDIWNAALDMKPQKFYTWEMEGRRDGAVDRPHITEAGPAVFDELYNTLTRQVSYLVWTPTHYRIVGIKELIRHSLNVLIAVPSASFFLDKESTNFTVSDSVRLSGCSPDLLHNTLDKLVSIGTDYLHVSQFTTDEVIQSGGLVLQAFVGGLRSYLQYYRAAVLAIKASEVQSPLQLSFAFKSWAKQLRFLADMCMCSWSFRKHGGPKPKFPTGVKLLSYLYQLALEHSSSSLYQVLLSLLKHSCTPYIMFVHKWVFKGICEDVYGEFIIEVDDQYLAYRDKHFWSHGFVMSGDEKLDCVPMFLSDLAEDIFVCGKSINLLRLCCPQHYLCNFSVVPPKMDVTFSMRKLKSCDDICSTYVAEMENVARELREEREQKRLAIEARAERAVLEEKERAEKALTEITGLIEKARQAVADKKREDFKMLKEQMEEALKKRVLVKEEKAEEDRKYMAEAATREGFSAAAEGEIKEKARQDLIRYYEKLSQEIERREIHANWQIKRHELDYKRLRFFAHERATLEALQSQHTETSKSDVPSKPSTQNQQPASSKVSDTKPAEVSVPSPSLVSLIASGLKTDALVRAEANKESDHSGADSGVVSLVPSRDPTPAPETTYQEISESHALKSAQTLENEDDTEISQASSTAGSALVTGTRKRWGKPEVGENLKDQFPSGTLRKEWEVPAEGDLTLPESQLPHGHPAESSIQFVMYGDKKTSLETEEPVGTPTIRLPQPSHPTDSSLQGLLYPAAGDEVPKQQSLADASLEAVLLEVATSPKSPHGHPSDSSAQSLIYDNQRGDVESLTNAASAQMPFLVSSQHSMYQESPSLHGHPSDSSAQDIMYENQDNKLEYPMPPASVPGHPSDSVLQDFLQSISSAVSRTPRATRTSSRTPTSTSGHPSDSKAEGILYPSENESFSPQNPRSRYGHPGDSTAQDYLYQTTEPQNGPRLPRSSFGHPSDSQIKTVDSSTTSEFSRPRSCHGHPSDATIQDYDAGVDIEPSHPRSQYGHPSDSQLDGVPEDRTGQMLSHKPRSQWGHPSNSTLQNMMGKIATLSDNQEQSSTAPHGILHPDTTRGTPPVDTAKGILYPGEEESVPGESIITTRGHEPAVTITKLMYPGGPDEEVKRLASKPIEFEDIWMASQVEPLRDNFDVLDNLPSTDLIKGALGGVMDTEEEDDSIDAAQLMSLPVLLQRSVTAPLIAQITLVNRAVVEYFIEELQVHKHFDVFRKFLFMEDGEFSLSLTDQLFEKLSSGVKPRELCSTTVMNGLITRALQLSVYADVTGLEQELAFALKWMPDMLKPNDVDALDFLELRYKVNWPVNIVITENSIIKYNKIFSFMLRLKRISWVLREIWFHLKHIAFSRNAAGSPQLRQLQLFRHEMQHFVQNIEGYLSNQILNVTWVEFQHELETNVRNLDELHRRHTEYLNKAIFRSLLSKKAAPVMKIINDIFSLVLKFRAQLYSCPWQQMTPDSHVSHPSFPLMCATHKAFKDYSGFLFTVVSKLVRRGYQSHLEDFLLRLNFNGFYNTA